MVKFMYYTVNRIDTKVDNSVCEYSETDALSHLHSSRLTTIPALTISKS